MERAQVCVIMFMDPCTMDATEGSIGSSLEQRSFKDLLVEMLMAMEVMVAEEEEVVVVMVMTSSEMVFELFDGGSQHMR